MGPGGTTQNLIGGLNSKVLLLSIYFKLWKFTKYPEIPEHLPFLNVQQNSLPAESSATKKLEYNFNSKAGMPDSRQ